MCDNYNVPKFTNYKPINNYINEIKFKNEISQHSG